MTVDPSGSKGAREVKTAYHFCYGGQVCYAWPSVRIPPSPFHAVGFQGVQGNCRSCGTLAQPLGNPDPPNAILWHRREVAHFPRQ